MPYNITEKLEFYLSSIWFLWALSLLVDIITFLFILFKIQPGNKTLALHYNVLLGVQWYGKGKNLYFLPGVGLIIWLANLTFYRANKNRDNFFNFLTLFVTLLAEATLLTAALFLAKVN